MSRCRNWLQRWRIRRHFAASISPRAERRLRAHLGFCDDCRAYYEVKLRFSEVDPRAKPAFERLGVGLGLRSRRAPVFGPVLFTVAAACAFLVWFRPAERPAVPEFAARGPAAIAHPTGVVRVYRGREPVRDVIDHDDELSFAYTNPEGFGYLLVLGMDERKNVFWYYPAWTDPSATPTAIPIKKSQTLVELPEAVRHELSGKTLRLLSIFSNQPLSVRAVEDRLSSTGAAPPGPLFPGTVEHAQRLEIR